MFIYVSMMLWTALCGLISKGSEQTCLIQGKHEKRINRIFVFLIMGYIVLFLGSLCGVGDIPAYERAFINTPTDPSQIKTYVEDGKYPGFSALQILFKIYISENFYNFTTLIIAFDCLALSYVFRRYSPDFAFTVFLFIASGKIFSLATATKQFLAAAIILAFSKFLMEKKFIPFAVGVIIASLFHKSAIIMLPVYFFVHGKPWNKKMLLILIATILSITFVSSFSSLLDSIMEDVGYGDSYIDSMKSGEGSNILHFLIASVPAAIALISKKKVEDLAPPYINVCINMSIVTACFYLAASFTSGILMGRLPIYTQTYSFISLAWLLENAFDKQTGKFLKISCVICYCVLYYLVFWETPYYSVLLNIYITP